MPADATQVEAATISHPPVSEFRRSEELLLAEARARFDVEQKSSSNLHSKGALYLAVIGVFAAFVASSLTKLVERKTGNPAEFVAIVLFAVSFVLFTVAVVRVSSSALARGYEVIARPAQWIKHLEEMRVVGDRVLSEEQVAARLERDILDAWVDAVEACYRVNQSKAAELHRVARLVAIAATVAIVAGSFLLAQALLGDFRLIWR